MTTIPVPPASRAGSAGLTAVSVAATTLTGLPTALVGALAVLISVDRPISTAQLGFIVAIFFAASATFSLPAGRVCAQLGPTRTMQLSAAATAIVLISIAALPWAYPELLLLFVLAGIANAATHVSVNLLLATAVVHRRQGLAFGVKQASVPAGPLLAGLAVPTIGLGIGWPWAFVIASAFAVAVMLAAAVLGPSHDSEEIRGSPSVRQHVPALALLSIAVGLASAAGNTLGPFLVSSAVAHGFAIGDAGSVLVLGSVSAVIARMVVGWVADNRPREDSLTIVCVLLAVGVAGFLLLGVATTPIALALAVVIAFGAGWGWAGLLWLSVARLSAIPAAAGMAIVQVGASGGAVLGPAIFGLLAQNMSFGLAWTATAATALAASVLTLVARQMLLPQLRVPAAATAGMRS